MSPAAGGRRVVVVTGGGGGIGAAIAMELGRRGDHVVTVDPLVTLDGSAPLPSAEETTAGRIVAAGGSARASAISVTDRDAVRQLFEELVAEHGHLDAVVNVAGITRPSSFTKGTEEDWRAVLSVHLDGYRNILDAAVPIMAAAGRGHILGVTSGSGWRAADTGAYGCAKRAVAALTWQLGAAAPEGVTINAMSPIAVTRMVTAALERAGAAVRTGTGSATGGLALGSMPDPTDIGPLGAHLVGAGFDACRGQVIFAGGSEAALVEAPRLLEAVGTAGATALDQLVAAVTTGALVPAEVGQASTGGSNPRFTAAYEPADADLPSAAVVETCAVMTDRAEVGATVIDALEARGVACTTISAADQVGGFDAVVVALGGAAGSAAASAWERVLVEHEGIVEHIYADAMWARAVADHAAEAERPVRLVSLVDASTAGGRSRAQAAAQLARASRRATKDRVAAFTVSVEGAIAEAAELAAHLVAGADTPALSGAELASGDGWFGLRSHPRPTGSIVLGAPDLPPWFDDILREVTP